VILWPEFFFLVAWMKQFYENFILYLAIYVFVNSHTIIFDKLNIYDFRIKASRFRRNHIAIVWVKQNHHIATSVWLQWQFNKLKTKWWLWLKSITGLWNYFLIIAKISKGKLYMYLSDICCGELGLWLVESAIISALVR